jgi:hypothetical protein
VLSFLGAPDAQDETAGWGKPGEAWHDITD